MDTSEKESETDSDDLFFDAHESTPRSRNSSMKRAKTLIKHVESIDSLSPMSEEGTQVEVRTNKFKEVTPSSVLPDEITKELEALSVVDDERKLRIKHLEKLRRREDVVPEDEEEDESRAEGGSLHESVESLLVRKSNDGPVTSHPFKVIESEVDRRSLNSDSRSVHSRQVSLQRIVSAESLQQKSGKSAELPTGDNLTTKPSANPNVRSPPLLPSHIPDVVSCARNDNQSTIEAFKNPVRPPRKKKNGSPTFSIEGAAPFGLPASPIVIQTSPKLISSPPELNSTPSQTQNDSATASRPTSLLTSTPRNNLLDGLSTWDPLPSPGSTVASLTRELETSLHKLDLQGAAKGSFVVKPQDDEKSRGESFLSRDSQAFESALERPFSCPEEKPSRMTRDDSSSYSLPADRPSSPEQNGESRFGVSGNRSFKGSSNSGNVSSSLGSHYNSATSGCFSDKGSGGKRSLNSGSSMESNRESSGLGASSGAKPINSFLRSKSVSGKKNSDDDLLNQVKVKNLDTGEVMNLNEAEDKLPASINPLSLHIMRITSEYVSIDTQKSSIDSDTESMLSSVSSYDLGAKKKISGMKKFLGSLGKKTTDAAKSLAAEATKRQQPIVSIKDDKEMEKKLGRLSTEIMSSEGVPASSMRDGKAQPIFKRIQAHKSGPFDFEGIKFAQELPTLHLGPIWCMKFSHCGQLLATAGQDTVLRIWVLKNSYNYFKDMRNRYNADTKSSPTNSYENVISEKIANDEKSFQIFVDTPFCSYNGHTSDLLDISWSKNYFILTSSMDKTVRLWHISRRECLCCFQHIDFVTAISFHPRNDQFFLSGSLDGKLRLWNIPDKKVALWNEVDGPTKLITAANFIQNGKFAVVGTYDGRCIFYSTDQLSYYTMIHVRSARGKNKEGRKVTGIEPMPGEDKILVTSNDSRIRLYDLRDLSLSCKFKGYTNSSSQIRAMFSPDGKYITAGSENQCVYIWKSQSDTTNLTVRKDRNNYYEAIKAHNAAVTCSVFAPNPDLILNQLNCQQNSFTSAILAEATNASSGDLMQRKGDPTLTKRESSAISNTSGYVLISADYDANIKVFFNISKPKHSSLPSPTSSSS